MCGIVGCLVFKNNTFTVSDTYINTMRDTMEHRGPDGAGTWISKDGKVGLGHRRLSIIDLSTSASQPMSNEDGTIQLVFNGEIYNYAAIRKELETTGKYTWKTDHSDTEVIIHTFEEWGIEGIHKFRGMFAIGLWDQKKQELWLVRDRIGIKPLYYSIHNGRITFASEIKALLKDPGQKRAVNEEAFYHYLSFLTSPAPHTLFSGINKLPPGTFIKIDKNGNVFEKRYWDILTKTSPLVDLTEDQIAEKILAELRIAVELHKVGDVPVGIFLSGGIDSSTNAALFSEGDCGKVKTFSIGYDQNYDSYQNELHFAEKMAAQIGSEHFVRLLKPEDLIDFLPRMIYLQDEPIADPVCVPVYYVSKLARDNGVIVCQVGEGSDELFWGYPSWRTSLKLQNYNNLPVPRIFKRLALSGLKSLQKDNGFKYEWLRRGANGQPIFWGGAEAFTETQKKKVISSRLRKEFANLTSWEAIKPIRQRFETNAWEKTPLHWMSYLDLNLRLPELLLMRVDKMSMGVSLEGRVPFLDHKFVELAMGIPQALKTKNDNLKYILKKAVRGIIPDELIDRKKQGFGVPIYEWFMGKLGNKTKKELDEFCQETDFLDKDEVSQLFKRGRSDQIWYLLNFSLWWKTFIKQENPH